MSIIQYLRINKKAMEGIIEGEFPLSEEIHKTTLSLPISYGHIFG